MKLCKDCKWCKDPGRFAKCAHPKNKVDDSAPYTGFNDDYALKIEYCSIHRAAGIIHCRVTGLCGKEGRWWEPKEANRCQV